MSALRAVLDQTPEATADGEDANRRLSPLPVVRLLRLEELAHRWEEIEALLAPAVERTRGCFEPIDVLRLAMAGQFGVWAVEQGGLLLAALVTEVRAYPRKKTLEVAFIGGVQVWRWHAAVVDAFDMHARAMGCDHIAGWGRPGWARFGFETWGAIMVRKVT